MNSVNNTFKNFVNGIADLIGGAISNLLLTAMVAAFLYTVVNFILKRSKGTAGDGMKDAKNQLGWSIIALFVAFSIWGIINFLQAGIFGPSGNTTQIAPPSVKVNTTNNTTGANAARSANPTNSTAPNYGNDGQRQVVETNKPSGSTCQINANCASNKCLRNREGKLICV